MKKLFAVLVALLVLAPLFVLPLTAFMVRTGFSHSDKPWAAGLVYRGARTRMRLLQYSTAGAVLQRAVTVFPRYRDVDRAHYWIALCCEKNEQPEQAVQWYQRFAERWPSHEWAAQARARAENLKAQSDL